MVADDGGGLVRLMVEVPWRKGVERVRDLN